MGETVDPVSNFQYRGKLSSASSSKVFQCVVKASSKFSAGGSIPSPRMELEIGTTSFDLADAEIRLVEPPAYQVSAIGLRVNSRGRKNSRQWFM